jgi:hypothetical protein
VLLVGSFEKWKKSVDTVMGAHQREGRENSAQFYEEANCANFFWFVKQREKDEQTQKSKAHADIIRKSCFKTLSDNYTHFVAKLRVLIVLLESNFDKKRIFRSLLYICRAQ